jgi:hypothetical protein
VGTYFVLAPEVPGGFGDRTQLRPTTSGPEVVTLHFEFEAGCQGNDLATSHPVFIISDRVGAELGAAGLTGFQLAEMEQTVDPDAYELDPDLELPTYRWLQITGHAGVADLGLDGADLVASERALEVLQRHAKLSLCDIDAWAPRVP